MKVAACFLMVIIIAMYMTTPSGLNAEEPSYSKAIDAYLKKDFRTAAEYFKSYVAKRPEAEAYYLLGYSIYMFNRKSSKNALAGRKEAEECFIQAYLIDPDFSPADIDFGNIKR